MAVFELPVRGLDGTLHMIEVLPSTQIKDMLSALRARFGLSQFYDISLLQGGTVLRCGDSGNVASMGLSDSEEVQMIKVMALDRVIEAIGQCACMDPAIFDSAMQILDNVDYLPQELSGKLVDAIDFLLQILIDLRGPESEAILGDQIQRLCSTFGRACHDPDFWIDRLNHGGCNVICQSWVRDALLLAIRVSKEDAAADDEDDNDERSKSNQLSFLEEGCISTKPCQGDGEDSTMLGHQMERTTATPEAGTSATMSPENADHKEDVLKALEASQATFEVEASQQEQTDVFKAIMLSKTVACDRAQSDPDRLQRNASSLSSWRCAVRDLPFIDATSDVTLEQWDERPSLATGNFPRELCASMLDAASDESMTTPWTSHLPESNVCVAPRPVSIADALRADHSAPSALNRSIEALPSDSKEQSHAGQGSKKTKDGNHRKRERDSKYKIKVKMVSDAAAVGEMD